jgi:hypothetical protein
MGYLVLMAKAQKAIAYGVKRCIRKNSLRAEFLAYTMIVPTCGSHTGKSDSFNRLLLRINSQTSGYLRYY